MCGFVAIASPDRPVDRDALARGRDALAHRGPDGRGLFVDDGCGLAHARLAIVDPEGGAQPIANEDGTVRVVASGEIYDHARLRRDLERRGHRFATRSDSELLVHLYEEHGADCAAHVHGELAFVLWDARARRLVAARDRFGVRPLVYASHDGALYLASEVKALFAAGVRRAWDVDAFLVAAQVQYVLPDRTLFDGVRTLPPGCVLVSEAGRVDVRRYWDLDYPTAPSRDVDPAAVAEVLGAAVAARAEVGAAYQLSGGLDSTAVLALGARHATRTPEAFTIAFDDAAYDERDGARASAAAIGAELHEVGAGAADLADAMVAAVAQGEGLAINAHIAAKWLLSRAISRAGYKVALSGEGSDEVFAGYAHLRRDLGVASPGNDLSLGTMLPDGETLPTRAAEDALGFVPTFLAAKAALGHRVRALLDPSLRRDDGVARLVDAIGVPRGIARVHASLHLWTRSALATYILRTLGDAMDMAHAVEVRLPFLDTRVFELARATPIDALIHDGVEKHVLREALRGVVPEPVRTRQKHPLLAPPFATAPSGPARELTCDLLLSGETPFFDRGALARLLDRVPAMDARARTVTEAPLMMALSACILQRTVAP